MHTHTIHPGIKDQKAGFFGKTCVHMDCMCKPLTFIVLATVNAQTDVENFEIIMMLKTLKFITYSVFVLGLYHFACVTKYV